MPKMKHWNSPEPVDVPAEKAAVYAAQGWVAVNEPPRKVQPAIVRETASAAPTEAAAPVPSVAEKAPAKKTAKKAAKKP